MGRTPISQIQNGIAYSTWLPTVYGYAYDGMVAHMAFAHRRPGRRAGGARTSRRGRRTIAYSNRQQLRITRPTGVPARGRVLVGAAPRGTTLVRPRRRARVCSSTRKLYMNMLTRLSRRNEKSNDMRRASPTSNSHTRNHVYPRHAITQQCSDGNKPAGRSSVVRAQPIILNRSVTQRATAPSPPDDPR